MRHFVLPFLICIALSHLQLPAQDLPASDDPCGFSLARPADLQEWGYGFSTLLSHVQGWSMHPYVAVDAIGTSVQQRPLFHLQITNPASQVKKRRIWLHARTHPIEAESSEVARAIIDELLSGSALAARILDHCVVHVLPMLNPDGVELQVARVNANGVDLESNWGADTPEKEVAALRRHLTGLMQSSAPIEVALNLHSAFTCKRYFVYHAEAGTSLLFTQLEQRYIDAVRREFPGGIESFDFFVTWTGGTPDRYPESWFWMNYREEVMALTYEDMNCATAGDFDMTARALLAGSAAYLGIDGTVGVHDIPVAGGISLEAVYPNPLPSSGTLSIALTSTASRRPALVALYDMLGRRVRAIWNGELEAGTRILQVAVDGLPAGSYHLLLRTPREVQRRIVVIGG